MAGLGRKTWSPGDTLTAADVNGYLMDQSVMVFAGTAARASAIPSPSAGMVAYSTATSLQVYNGSAWVDLSTGYGAASGATGTATVSGTTYAYAAITATGTFTVTKAGLFDVLVFGGGCGGGGDNSYSGGGGSGGISQQTVYFSANQTVTIGAGGAVDASGNPSSVGTIPTAIAAAGGIYVGSVTSRYQNIGAFSGAGVGTNTGSTNIQGYAGGASSTNAGGGGGSTTAVGGNAAANVGGAGGAGFDVSAFIGGSALYKGAGGGGGAANVGGAGGSSIGGTGATGAGNATAAAANTASGGGSRGSSGSAAAGGSGIIYIRWKV